jgi:uncharacterized protein involved in exopolysaccharide biosynthesis
MRQIDSEYWESGRSLDISLRELAAPLFRRKQVLIATFLIALTVAVAATLLVPPQFTSHMSLLVNRERLDPLVTTEATTRTLTSSQPASEEEINSEAQLVKSRDVLEQVVYANGLQKQHGFSLQSLFHPRQTQADRVERAVRALSKEIKVATGTKTNLIEISYTSSNPQLSYEVLKSLSNFYMEKHVAIHRPAGSYQFFAQETKTYRKAMEDSEARLRGFEKQPGAADPELERTDLALQVTNAIGQLHQDEESIAADQQRIRSDQQQMKATPERSATLQSTTQADKLLEYLEPALIAAETKRTELALKYDPHYPLVQEADQEVATAKAAIADAQKKWYVTQTTDRDPIFELLREDATKAQTDLVDHRARLAAIKHSIQSLQTEMVDLGQKSLAQQDLLRDIKANESNYLLYLSKREQERTSDALDKTNIANVAIAVPPDIPALPTHGFAFLLVLAVFFATVLAIAVAYLVEYFDSSFHTPAQVVDMLGIPIVVAVPKKSA